MNNSPVGKDEAVADLAPASVGTQTETDAVARIGPATALPWDHDEGESVARAGYYVCDGTGRALWDDGQSDGGVCSYGDAAYIVHSANAYPKLIRALKDSMFEIKRSVGEIESSARTDGMALLRQLGEL